MMRILVCMMIVLAGCAGSGPEPGDDAPVAAVSADIPTPCDATRPAVVHGASGAFAEPDGATGVACFASTSWGTSEPSLGLTSSGALFVYPAVEPPLAAMPTGGHITGLGIARSFDDGATFDHRQSMIGPVNYHFFTADPFMFVDTYTDRVFMEDLAVPPFNCSNLSYSDDEGQTWQQALGGCMVWDHVGYASGPPIVSEPSWPVIIQRCAGTLVATALASQASGCQKSLDGGATWEIPGEPAFLFDQDGVPYVPGTCHGGVHHPFIDHRGWTWLARLWCDGNPWVAISKDEGATWMRHQIGTGAAAWHDVGIGVDPDGTAYAFWIGVGDRPVLAVSRDDGLTWSDPIDIAPPGLVAAGMASLQPGGVGKAAFSYVATFEGMDGNHAVVAAGYGLDGPAPRFHTAVATTHEAPLTGGGCSGGLCSGQTDFLDAAIGPDGTPWGSFAHNGDAAAARLWGAPSLWDASDPNGTYGNG